MKIKKKRYKLNHVSALKETGTSDAKLSLGNTTSKRNKGKDPKGNSYFIFGIVFSLSFLVNLSKGLREEILDTLCNWSFLACLPIPK